MTALIAALLARAWLPITIALVMCATAFGLGHSIASNKAAGKVASAQHERDTARHELASYRLQVREAAAQHATAAATTTIQQTRTTMESAHAHITHRTSLQRRIDAGSLHYPNRGSTGLCGTAALADPPARAAHDTPKPLLAEAQRDPEALPDRLANPLPPPAELIANAALDAQQLADLIDTACKLGLCAKPSPSP